MYQLKSLIVSAAVVAALFAIGALPGSALAAPDSIAHVNANDAYNQPVELGESSRNGYSDAVITAILSQPGVVHGKTYTGWAIYVNDGTSGADIYASSASMVSLGYTPTVGDGLDLKGAWQPYHSFGELALNSSSTITINSTGNTVALPPAFTVGGVLDDIGNASNGQLTGTNGTNSNYQTEVMPNDLTSQLITIDNVKLTWGATTSTPAHLLGGATSSNNVQCIMTDGTTPLTSNGISLLSSQATGFGGSGMTYTPGTQGAALSFYYWPTSYSVASQNLFGDQLDFTGNTAYDMTGFLSVFNGTGTGLPGGLIEFSPITMTLAGGGAVPTPEPGTLALLGAGAAVAAVTYIRRKRRNSIPRTA